MSPSVWQASASYLGRGFVLGSDALHRGSCSLVRLQYLIFYAVLLFFPTMEGAAQQKTDAPVDHGGKLCSRSNQSSVGHPVLGSVTRELYVPAH